MPTTDIEARIAALEAKEKVKAVVADYCRKLDAVDIEAVSDLFVADAVLANPAGEHVGHARISDYYQAFAEAGTSFTRHHVINQEIEILEPGRARHRAYFIALLGRSGESSFAVGEYDDILIETADGWKFQRKGNLVMGSTTAERGWADGF